MRWKYPSRMTTVPDRVDRIVAEWRRERPDVDVAPLELFARLFRAAHLADAALAGALAGHDLRPGWFDLLAALRRSGPPYELNPTELTRATMLSSGGTTKRLDRLAGAGLIERQARPPRPPRDTRRVSRDAGRRPSTERWRPTSRTRRGSSPRSPQPSATSLDAGLRKLLTRLEGSP